ncbi:MAG: sigma-70 family RNA polymerase sigma factor [Bacilli bacterium]|nr:sigma-70 family RNA polymerase sigma factor [Bacilli bacterium]
MESDIVKLNEWLIFKVAKCFYNADLEDLYQAGALGIVKAYQNYHNNGTTKFSTYAYDYVYGEMYQMVYRNQSIKLSKDILKTFQKIEITRSSLAQKLGKVPSNDEIAQFLEMDPVVVGQIVEAGTRIMVSMDASSTEERSYYETVAEPEKVSLDETLTLKECMNQTLSPDEKKIITYRYFGDMTQSETAKALNMTQVMVSRYEKRSLQKMHSYYGEYVA